MCAPTQGPRYFDDISPWLRGSNLEELSDCETIKDFSQSPPSGKEIWRGGPGVDLKLSKTEKSKIHFGKS